LELRHEVLVEDVVPVLVVTFRGRLATDPPRAELAEALAMAVQRASEAAPRPELAVLDTTSLSDELISRLGKFVDWVPRGLAGRLWRWAAGPDDAASVASWFGDSVIIDSASAGIAGLVAYRHAGRLDERGPDGRICRSLEWTERGLLETVPDDDGGRTTSLWFRTHLIERALYGPSGEPEKILWPFPDALAGESPAIRLGARVVVRDSAIREVDLNPGQTRRPLALDWLATLGALPELEALYLFRTGADDADVLAALARFPRLRRLRIDGTNVTDALADALAGGLAPQLEEIVLDELRVSKAARVRLEAARLELHVH
jgi:hypothetical protein